MQVRRVLPGDAVLLRSGEREPKLVDASEFQSRLETAGVWARASLPTSPQQVAAALLPLLLVLLAGGLLGLAAPALVLRAPRPRLAAQLVMVACVAGFAVAALEGGALGWAGRRAFQEQPALPWR
jgi:hypothetical protein